MVYEHYHRYLWAAQLVRGSRVLDLGSGEGFGAAMLAQTAAEVLGVDVDERAVLHSRANYERPNLRFEQASATDLSAIASGSLDAVVAFEMIEHVREQELVVAEIARVLKRDGIVIMSTPDARYYSAATGQDNPFHERELTVEEFETLLHGQFANVAMWGQRTIAGSYMRRFETTPPADRMPATDHARAAETTPAADHAPPTDHARAAERTRAGEAGPVADFFLAREEGEWRVTGQPQVLFCIALASRARLPRMADGSTLADCDLEVVRQAERAGAAAVAERDALISDAHHHLELRAREITALEARRVELEHRRAALEWELEKVEQSVSWQMLQRGRARLYGAIGEDSRMGRAVSASLRLLGRLTVLRRR